MREKAISFLLLVLGLLGFLRGMSSANLLRGSSITGIHKNLVDMVGSTTPEEVRIEIVRLINADREALGLKPLVLNDQLMWMARVRSDDMVAADYAGHRPPPGHPSVKDLTEQLGYNVMQRPMENIVLVPIPEGRLDAVPGRAVSARRASSDHWAWVAIDDYWMTGVGVTVHDERAHVIVPQLFWGPNGVTPHRSRTTQPRGSIGKVRSCRSLESSRNQILEV